MQISGSLLLINNLLKVFYKIEEVVLYNLCKDSKGDYITNTEHNPESKNITTEEVLSRQETEMRQIGPRHFGWKCKEFCVIR